MPAWPPGQAPPVRAGHAHGSQLPSPAGLPVPVGEDSAPNPVVCLQDGDLRDDGQQAGALAPPTDSPSPPCRSPHAAPTQSSIPTAAQMEMKEGSFFYGEVGGAGGRTESHSEHVQCDNFQTAAGRPLARFQRDFPAQGVGRFLVCTEATGLAYTHSWISVRGTVVRLQGALPLVWSFHLHQHKFLPGSWKRFQGTFLQDESGAGKVKALSTDTCSLWVSC